MFGFVPRTRQMLALVTLYTKISRVRCQSCICLSLALLGSVLQLYLICVCTVEDKILRNMEPDWSTDS